MLFFSLSHGRRQGTRRGHGTTLLCELLFSRAAGLNCCCLHRAPVPLQPRAVSFHHHCTGPAYSVGSRISTLLISSGSSCLCKVFLPGVPPGAGLWEALKGRASLPLRSKRRRCPSPALCWGRARVPRCRPCCFPAPALQAAAGSGQELWDLKAFLSACWRWQPSPPPRQLYQLCLSARRGNKRGACRCLKLSF